MARVDAKRTVREPLRGAVRTCEGVDCGAAAMVCRNSLSAEEAEEAAEQPEFDVPRGRLAPPEGIRGSAAKLSTAAARTVEELPISTSIWCAACALPTDSPTLGSLP